MSVAKKVKIVSTYVLLGCPIGTLSLLLVSLIADPSPFRVGLPSLSDFVDFLKFAVAGYICGFIPAACAGIAHLYAQSHAFSRKQIVGFVSAVGVIAPVISFGVGFGMESPEFWTNAKLPALFAVTGLIPAAVVSLLLTRSSIRDTLDQ